MIIPELMELRIETTLPSFITNFEEVKTQVQERLKGYDIAVSAENLSEAKKLATELNFFAKKINEKRIEKQKEASAPIEILKSQADELIRLFNEGREKLLSQIKVFEDKKRNLCLKLLKEELEMQYQKASIEEEYRNIKIDDLAILSNLTDTDSLSKKAKNEILHRTGHALAIQMQVNNRLLNLENACFKAGLKSLLERKHIESFLKEPEEIYNTKLNSLIETESRRQKEIQEKLLKQEDERLKKEAEAKVKEEMQRQAEAQKPIEQAPVEEKEEEIIKEVQATSNPNHAIAHTPATSKVEVDILDEIEEPQKQRFMITAMFEIEAVGETADTLKQKYLDKLSKDFKTIRDIEVSRINRVG